MPLNNYKILSQQISSPRKIISVATFAITSNVATITTPEDHGLQIGDLVFISGVQNNLFNGVFSVLAVPSSTSFTFNRTNANISSTAATNGTITISKPSIGFNITTKERTGNLAILSSGSVVHTLAVDDLIFVSHGTDTTFDGYYYVNSVPSATTFTYRSPGSNVASTGATGSVSAFKPKVSYQTPSQRQAIVSTLNISNTTSNGTTTNVYAVRSSQTVSASTQLYESINLQGNETITLTLGLSLDSGESLQVLSPGSGVVYTAFGSELS